MDNEIFWISFYLIWFICAHIGLAMHTSHRHYGSVNWVSVSTLQFGMKIFTLSIPVWRFYVKKFGLFLSSWQMYWRAEKLYNMCWNWGQPQPTANTVSAPNKGKKRKEKKRTSFYHSLPFEWISCLNWAHLGWSPSQDLCSSLWISSSIFLNLPTQICYLGYSTWRVSS
jgi:hypothetical protein